MGFIDCVECTGSVTTPCGKKALKKEMYLDPFGRYWCKDHEYLGKLLTWAHEHSYPAITFQGGMRYAIGCPDASLEDNKYLWQAAVLLGCDDMVWTALSYVMMEPQED